MRIDCHSHVFSDRLPALGERYGDPRWPAVQKDGDASISVMVNGSLYRRIGETAWNVERRLEEMDREQVDVHVISVTPITLGYWGDPKGTLELARYQNDFIASIVAAHKERFIGLGTVPLQDPQAAIAELTRVRKELKLAGVELGATVRGLGLHIEELRPFFRAAADLDCPIFVHPLNEDWAWDERVKKAGLGLINGLGMPHETGLSAAAMIMSGLFIEFPNLRCCLAHGGGSLAAVLPRIAHQWEMRRSPQATGVNPLEQARKLWVDDITYDFDAFLLCKARFGADKIVAGTDYPYDAGRERPAGAMFDLAASRGVISAAEHEDMTSRNALRFLYGK